MGDAPSTFQVVYKDDSKGRCQKFGSKFLKWVFGEPSHACMNMEVLLVEFYGGRNMWAHVRFVKCHESAL